MFKVRITDAEQDITCSGSQTLLDAALRQGTRIPYACKGGGCGMCKIAIEAGEFERGASSKDVLPDEERRMNYTLACKTYPRSDMKVRIQIG